MDLQEQQPIITNQDPIVAPVSQSDTVSPVTPNFVPAPKSSFPWLAIISSVFLTATILVGFYFFTQTQSPRKQLTITPSVAPTTTAAPSSDSTADWQTYTDSTIENISFKYPTKYKIELLPGDGGTVVTYQFAPDYLINLSVLRKYSTIQTKQYEGTSSSGDIVIGNNTWKIYSLLKGPKGTVGEENPRYVLQSEINKHLVIFVLSNQTSITDEQKQILSTFRFTSQ